jgi:hypothetical protein
MTPPDDKKSVSVAEKRKGGIKLVVKSKRKKMKRPVTTTPKTRGLPAEAQPQQHQANEAGMHVNSQHLKSHQIMDYDHVEEDEEIPCDTLLAIRSIEQTRQCLDIPLYVGTVPCVLESQLQDKLQSHDEGDSIVTSELQQLTQSNKIRRLTAASDRGHDVVEAVMETRYYKRAVWDAHRHFHGSDALITAGFVSCLDRLTKRRISANDLRQYWPKHKTWKDNHLDTLVQMQVLLPVKNDAYIIWLPHWGLVLKQLSKARQKVFTQVKRSLYKEMSQSQVERIHHTGLSGQFVLHTLVAQGLVELQERPSGTFVRLV